MRWALVLLLLCGGCTLHRDELRDAELQAAGEWTPADQRARELLDAGGLAGRPVRKVPWHRKFVDELELGGKRIPVPRIGSQGFDFSALFGLHFEPRYRVVPEHNAFILLHRGRPATILPIDPDRPVGPEPPETPERAYRRAGELLDRDLEQLPPPPTEPLPFIQP